MKNIFSKINNERVRIVSKTRDVSLLQESKICLATTITKKTKEVNSFAKGSSEPRIVDASQSHKKAIVNQKAIKPAQRVSFAGQKTIDNPTSKEHKKQVNITSQPTSKPEDRRAQDESDGSLSHGQKQTTNHKLR